MATKWKSSLLMISICSLLFTISLSGLLFLSGYVYFYAQKDYFHTPEFQDEIYKFAQDLGVFELNQMSIKEAKAAISVTEEEIQEHRYRYGDLPEQMESIRSQYEEEINQALESDNQEAADAYVQERDEKIKNITKNFESDEHVEAKIRKDKEKKIVEYYRQKEDYQSNFENDSDIYAYYFTDSISGEVYTNLDTTDAKAGMNEKGMLFVTEFSLPDDNMVNYEFVGSDIMLDIFSDSERSMDGWIGISKSLSSTNPVMLKYDDYKTEQKIYWILVSLSLITLLISLLIFHKAKKSRSEIAKWSSYYNKLPIDVRILLFVLTGIVTLFMMFSIESNIYHITEHSIDYSLQLVIANLILSISFALTFIQAVFLFTAIKNWKTIIQQWNESLFYRTFQAVRRLFIKLTFHVKEVFLDQTFGIQVIFVFGLVFFLGLIAVIIFIHPIFVFIYFILLGVVGIPTAMIIAKKIGYFNRIVETTNELAAGNLAQELQVNGQSIFAKHANNINYLKEGVQASQNEQAKSERLKTELITNVSHDLRTPLTSIITYTELLKKQQDTSEESAAYLEIIDRKSKRLKILIDDLFEVSKMASGNVELKKEKVDLVQLLQQALAEYDDRIFESRLQFRVSNDDPPIHAMVDGQKLWRVFDNLIGNILKYSLENSRVYINLSAIKNQAIITFKNVSKYELNENNEELFERFKRGDTSRNTEGSGLGLAIAQSIVNLHGGSLEIETDGDLFKVTIHLKIQEV